MRKKYLKLPAASGGESSICKVKDICIRSLAPGNELADKFKWAAGIFILCAVSCGELPAGKVQQEAWQTVKTINRHWAITENLDSLSLYLHPDMILVAAEAKDRLDGRDKILESYRSYTRYARTLSLQELDPIVRIYNRGRSAVVTYNYDLEIETPAGEPQRFTGRDMYTLVREKDGWQAVAQHFSPLPKQEAGIDP